MPVADVTSAARPSWLDPYKPLFDNGDLQTVAARYWPVRLDAKGGPTESRLFDTEPGVKVLGKITRADGASTGKATVVIVHGLTACSEARYMLSLANRALERGFDVARMNVRSCGGTEHLSPTLYHSGLTIDLRHVVEQLAPRPLFVAGFSMGGNMTLKLAGEWGEEAPAHWAGACGISVPIQLDACARRIGERRNRIYEYRFLRQLRQAMQRKMAVTSDFWQDEEAFLRADSIWEFDDKVTAKAFGFADAGDYYRRSSAAGYLERVRIPALLIEAADDPFIPIDVYDAAVLSENPWLQLVTSAAGGHVAFLSRNGSSGSGRRFWAEEQALNFFEAILASRRPGLPS